jgi:chloramphenicol-sensitive protein RarD
VTTPSEPDRRGIALGAAAYVLWGLFPPFFRLLEPAAPAEILAHRVLWTLVFMAVVLAVLRGWGALRALSARGWAMVTAAAVLIAVNWGLFIYAVGVGHVVEVALGYFIGPLVSVLLGVLVLRERLRPLQWAAVGVGTLAVAVLTVAYGRPPFIALTLAVSFGLYGLIKNRVGASVGALASLTTETLVLAPVAAVGLVLLEVRGQGHFSDNAPWQALLLASVGVATVVPLLFFAAAARRVPLSTVGLLQYLTPTLQLLCGVVLLGEHMSAARWAGFALVWVALVVLTADTVRAASRRRTQARIAEPVGAA